MKRLKLLFLLSGLALLAASATAAFGHTAHVAGSAATVTTKSTKLGTILVTSSGKTIYLDTGDKSGHFACTGACAKAWPPLSTSGKPKAAGKVKASMLGTIKNGKVTQVTYNGHPLYTYSGDTKRGDINSQNLKLFGAKWYVVSVAGPPIR